MSTAKCMPRQHAGLGHQNVCFLALPDELILKIFSFAAQHDFICLSRACKKLALVVLSLGNYQRLRFKCNQRTYRIEKQALTQNMKAWPTVAGFELRLAHNPCRIQDQHHTVMLSGLLTKIYYSTETPMGIQYLKLQGAVLNEFLPHHLQLYCPNLGTLILEDCDIMSVPSTDCSPQHSQRVSQHDATVVPISSFREHGLAPETEPAKPRVANGSILGHLPVEDSSSSSSDHICVSPDGNRHASLSRLMHLEVKGCRFWAVQPYSKADLCAALPCLKACSFTQNSIIKAEYCRLDEACNSTACQAGTLMPAGRKVEVPASPQLCATVNDVFSMHTPAYMMNMLDLPDVTLDDYALKTILKWAPNLQQLNVGEFNLVGNSNTSAPAHGSLHTLKIRCMDSLQSVLSLAYLPRPRAGHRAAEASSRPSCWSQPSYEKSPMRQPWHASYDPGSACSGQVTHCQHVGTPPVLMWDGPEDGVLDLLTIFSDLQEHADDAHKILEQLGAAIQVVRSWGGLQIAPGVSPVICTVDVLDGTSPFLPYILDLLGNVPNLEICNAQPLFLQAVGSLMGLSRLQHLTLHGCSPVPIAMCRLAALTNMVSLTVDQRVSHADLAKFVTFRNTAVSITRQIWCEQEDDSNVSAADMNGQGAAITEMISSTGKQEFITYVAEINYE